MAGDGPDHQLRHLARRFAASVRARPPSAEDETWAETWLQAAELALWRRHRPNDRRHTLAVARSVYAVFPDAPRWVLAAALLHDIGKIEADLSIGGRVVAGLLALFGVRQAPGTLGRYLGYPAIGEALLRAAGSTPEVAAWAAEHHEPARAWTVPAEWAARLAAADEHAV